MASNHTTTVVVSILVDFKLTGLVSSSAHSCQQWAGPIFHSLLSAHHLIGTYLLTTESDKCMHLLTRLYDVMCTLTCQTAVYDMVSKNRQYPMELHLGVQVGPDKEN